MVMVKYIFVLVVFLFVASCAQSPVEPPKEVTTLAYSKLYECLIKNTVSLDDGVSDAKTVATALMSPCHNEFKEIRRLSSFHITNSVARERYVDFPSPATKEYQHNIALKTVLRYRAKKNSKIKNSPQPKSTGQVL